jgi:putative spermidine/putrescine transport system permease protein
VVLVGLALTALFVYRRLLRRGMRWLNSGSGSAAAADTSEPAGQQHGSLGGRLFKIVLFGGVAIYLIVPLVAVALYSVAGRWVGPLPDYLTLDNWLESFSSPTITSAFSTSLWLAFWTTLIVIVLTVPAVYWAHVANRRIRPLLELAAVIPFALPFVVIGFAVLVFSGMAMPQLQGTFALLVMVSVAVAFPFVYWTVDASMAAADVRRLTEAAAACGASQAQTLRRVVLPGIKAGIATAAMLSFALAIGEFAIVRMLGGGIVTIPIWSAQQMETRGGGLGPLAVITTVVFAILFVLSVAIALVNRGRAASVGPSTGNVAPAGQQ